MADDVTLNEMSGGDVVGADEISGVKYQRVKIIAGANGTNDGDVCAGAPLPVTAAITAVVPGVAATSLGKAIDTALGATDTGVLALAVRDDTLNVRSGTENDVEPLHTDASGALWTRDAAVATAIGVEDAAETAGGGLMMAGAVRRDTCASSAGATGDNATINTDAVGALWVDPQGNVAHDTADAGNPVKVGGRAVLTTSTQTMVAANDRTDFLADADGAQITTPYCPKGDILSVRVSNTDGASTAFTVFDNAAGMKNYITTIVGYNSSATGCYVDLRDGTAGGVIFTIPLPAGGGCVINFPVPLKQPTAATALAFDVSGAISTVYLSLVGFKSKVA